jgi:hypothetical protein
MLTANPTVTAIQSESGWALTITFARRLALGVLYIFLVSVVAILFITDTDILSTDYGNPRATVEHLIEGTAHKPFVYRTLLPSAVRFISMVTPRKAIEMLKFHASNSSLVQIFLRDLHVPERYLYESLWIFGLIYASLFGYAISMFYLARLLLSDTTPIAAHLSSIMAIVAIPPFFAGGWGYIYDLPVLFLITASLYFLARAQWLAYFTWFGLACLNKETAILLLFVFAANFYDRLTMRRFFVLAVMHLIIFSTIKLALTWIYLDNPGHMMEYYLLRNLKHYFSPYTYADFFVSLSIFFVLTYGWTYKSLFLKRSLWMIPPLCVSYLMGGWPGEYRVFYEILPILTLLFSDSVIRSIRA